MCLDSSNVFLFWSYLRSKLTSYVHFVPRIAFFVIFVTRSFFFFLFRAVKIRRPDSIGQFTPSLFFRFWFLSFVLKLFLFECRVFVVIKLFFFAVVPTRLCVFVFVWALLCNFIVSFTFFREHCHWANLRMFSLIWFKAFM